VHGPHSDTIRAEIERTVHAAEAAREMARQAERDLRHAEREAERQLRDAERELRHAEREAEREVEREARRAGMEEQWSAQQERAQEMADLTEQIRNVGERLRQPDLENGQREELLQRLNDLMTTLQNVAQIAPAAG
jgi:hypothetical protein